MPGRRLYPAATQAVETKREALRQYVREVEIRVPQIPYDRLLARAVHHYNDRRDLDGDPANLDSPPAFLERIAVNYLRHHLTSYEENLAEVYGKVGVPFAIQSIRSKVYGAIASAYPQLRQECERQRSWRDLVVQQQRRSNSG